MRGRIVETFLRVWRGVAAWTTIWGPRGAQRLADALGRIGADPRLEPDAAAEVLHALALGLERISAVRALGALFNADRVTRPLALDMVDVGGQILDKWIEPEISPEELRIVLCASARAAARDETGSRSRKAGEARRRVAELLFDALREGRDWAREPLQALLRCKALPKNLRKEIEDRLKKAFVLVKA